MSSVEGEEASEGQAAHPICSPHAGCWVKVQSPHDLEVLMLCEASSKYSSLRSASYNPPPS